MKCPYCGCKDNWGMNRYSWMCRVPTLVNRRCSRCGKEYARFLNFIPLRHDSAKKLSFFVLTIKLLILASIVAFVIILLIQKQYALPTN